MKWMLTFITLLLLAGCKIQFSVPEGGSVRTESGSFECSSGQQCEIAIVDVFFDETFIAEPESGYEFLSWKKKARGFCGGKAKPCRIFTTIFANFPELLPFLVSDEIYYLEPVFIGSTSDSPYAQAIPVIDDYLHSSGFEGSVLIGHQGEILLREGYGFADRDAAVPNTSHTKFRIGSITKQFTAASILLLQERGQLQASDLVCAYINNCPGAWQAITIHHLLTHTSGIPNYTDISEILQNILSGTPSPEELINSFSGLPLDFVPGSTWSYSNSGYATLGLIIENVSGTSYEGFLRDNILTPLSMMASGITADENESEFATGYDGIELALPAPLSAAYAAGAMYSTVEDLYWWDRALYTDVLLSDEQRAQMFEPHAQTDEESWYGYGWRIETISGRKHISHGGGIFGFVSYISRYPEEELTIILLMNDETANPIDPYTNITGLLFAN
jgi:CubicO group peptidase (beta-lactamase class C family)